jgi:hypothetical protein
LTFFSEAPSPAPSPAPAGRPPFSVTACFNDCLGEYGIPAAITGIIAALCGLTPGALPCAVAATLVGAGVVESCLFRCGLLGVGLSQAGPPEGEGEAFAIRAQPQSLPPGAQQGGTRVLPMTPQQQFVAVAHSLSQQLAARGIRVTPERAMQLLAARMQAQRQPGMR